MTQSDLRRMSQDELGQLLKALARLGVFIKDYENDTHVPNTFWLEWGYSPEDLKGDRWLQALHPDDRNAVLESLRRHERGEEEVSRSTHRVITKLGNTRWVLSKAVMASRYHDGRPRRMIGIDYDVTEMKEAQNELAQARKVAERRAKEAETLRRAGAAIASTLDRRQAVARVLEFLKSVVDYRTATVQVLSGNELEVIDASGPVAETCRQGARFALEEYEEYDRIVRERSADLRVIVRQTTPDLPVDVDHECVSWIGVPLITQETTHGILTLAGSGPGHFESRDLDLATALGDYVALAIQNAKLYDETRQAASTDPLTGAFTRYWFVPFATREVIRSRRESSPLSLLVLDLDDFKHVNDEYGHPAGDTVLKTLARTIADALRASDPLCRLGGEEFAVLLPGAHPPIARRVAERLCRAAAQLSYDCCGGLSVTVSVGVASLTPEITTYDDLMLAADRALYRAKREGRNRVSVANGSA
ncbi:MAG: diguanylate cyclase [Spirochaetota bacterium]